MIIVETFNSILIIPDKLVDAKSAKSPAETSKILIINMSAISLRDFRSVFC